MNLDGSVDVLRFRESFLTKGEEASLDSTVWKLVHLMLYHKIQQIFVFIPVLPGAVSIVLDKGALW